MQDDTSSNLCFTHNPQQHASASLTLSLLLTHLRALCRHQTRCLVFPTSNSAKLPLRGDFYAGPIPSVESSTFGLWWKSFTRDPCTTLLPNHTWVPLRSRGFHTDNGYFYSTPSTLRDTAMDIMDPAYGGSAQFTVATLS